MLKSLKLRAVLILVFLFISVVYLVPNVVNLEGAWKKYFPSEKIHLGLDLKGGMHLLLSLDTNRLLDNMLDRKFNQLKEGMIREGIRFIALDKRADRIDVVIKTEQREKLYNLLGKEMPDIKVTGSKTEGDNLSIDLSYSEKEVANLKDNAVHQALETIRNRIDQFGVSEPVIVQQGETNILVQLPGIKDPERALELIGKTAQLEFKLVDEENTSRAESGPVPEGDERLMMKSRNKETGVTTTTPILLKKQTLLTGDMLTDARVRIGGEFRNEPYVALEFNSEGSRIFERVTGENVGKRIAIILDNTVYSAPVVRERISGGKASVTGGFTPDEAKDLAIVLRAGALPAPVSVIQNITIGPTLGQDSIRKGVQAAVTGRPPRHRLHGLLLPGFRHSGRHSALSEPGIPSRRVYGHAGHNDPAGHSGHHPYDRHGRRYERADLRAHTGGAAPREDGARRRRRRLLEGVGDHLRRAYHHPDHHVHSFHIRHGPHKGLCSYPRHRHHHQSFHGRIRLENHFRLDTGEV